MNHDAPHLERVLARVTADGGCWRWGGAICDGYGYVHARGKSRRVHRVLYEDLIGPIPEGLTLDHLCRNRACCNPLHLEPVTSTENSARGESGRNNAIKTECPKGHAYSAENTKIVLRADGSFRGRRCRTCERSR